MKNIRINKAVSEIVGIAILLGISISLFVIVQTLVLSYPFEPSPPSVNLVGTINGENIFIEHHGGESISLDSKIIITIGDEVETNILALDYLDTESSNNNNIWDIGEIVSYPTNLDIANKYVSATVVDVKTNSIVMTGVIQEGII
jgi:hypothetical protein